MTATGSKEDGGSPDAKDMEGIGLLRQIFPELSIEELHRLHMDRVQKLGSKVAHKAQAVNGDDATHTPSSVLGQRIWNQLAWLEEENSEHVPMQWRPMELPDDFLRLPSDVAVRRFNEKNNKWYYLIVDRLEAQVLEHHQAQEEFSGAAVALTAKQDCYTKVIYRNGADGLGMSLCEEGGRIWVHSLLGKNGNRWFITPPPGEEGLAISAGIVPGDWLLGINGNALVGNINLLRHAVSAIQYSADPVVLHLRRVPTNKWHPLVQKNGALQSVPLNAASLLDTSTLSTDDSLEYCVPEKTFSVPKPLIAIPPSTWIHPFVNELEAKGLMRGIQDKVACTNRLAQFTTRARQWESFSSFRLDARSYNISPHFHPADLPSHLSNCVLTNNGKIMNGEPVPSFAPSTPTLDPAIDYIPPEYLGHITESCPNSDENTVHTSNKSLSPMRSLGARNESTPVLSTAVTTKFPGVRSSNPLGSDILIPLMGVRKALCVRIVNTFLENNRTAYTIWAFDVEAGREWYAPVRYLRDFQDLRSAAIPLCPSLTQIPFPQNNKWNVFGREKAESEEVRDSKCRQLEGFLRKLSHILYTEKLHPVISEIAIHLQSFLGCDGSDTNLHLQAQITLNEAMVWQMPETSHNESQMKVRLLLKRSIQRYVFRLFLLDQLQRVVADFVDATRERAPTLRQIELIESKGRNKLKERAMEDLERIQAFLDQMQTIILEGCRDDLCSIARRNTFLVLSPFMEGPAGDAYLDRVFRESVREQIEIEIYVPLRGNVSRLLVNGWRHDDMEIHFKMNELRQRPQSAFRIPHEKESPSGWSSVSSILNEGVGMSTLPCAKLRAIVDSAKEISRVFEEEEKYRTHNSTLSSSDELGADDFLPIFIYCVVQAEMERPCALCVLLRTLCDPTNRIGEVGYYLASFEAALTHIQEINLAES